MSSVTKGVSKILRMDEWVCSRMHFARDTEDGVTITITHFPAAVEAGLPTAFCVLDDTEDQDKPLTPANSFKTERQALRCANKRAKDFGGWERW